MLGPSAFQEIGLASAYAPVARFNELFCVTPDPVELMNQRTKTAIVRRDVAT